LSRSAEKHSHGSTGSTPISRGGFTLLEVLAAVALTALVIATALGFQMQLSSAVLIAADRTEKARHAVAILDRVARDLESTVLLQKPPEMDPLDHPWIFLGESDLGLEGSDRIKFVRGGYRTRSDEGHSSDLVMVTYTLHDSLNEEEEERGYELRRRIFPRLPDALDRSFPEADDERAFLLADGLAYFALYFYDETGGEVADWDSSLIARSGQLPISVRIEVAMLAEGEDPDDFDPEKSTIYTRRVVLPLRPIEMALLLPRVEDEANEDGLGEEAGAMTIGECLALAGAEIDQSLLQVLAVEAGIDFAATLQMNIDDWPFAPSPVPEACH